MTNWETVRQLHPLLAMTVDGLRADRLELSLNAVLTRIRLLETIGHCKRQDADSAIIALSRYLRGEGSN